MLGNAATVEAPSAAAIMANLNMAEARVDRVDKDDRVGAVDRWGLRTHPRRAPPLYTRHLSSAVASLHMVGNAR